MNIAIGDKEIDFVFQGDRLIYPSYAGKESMVLHYDFSGMKNTDVTKGVAEDLSGNGNNGTLQNFAYDAGSGYEDNGLMFDGVDDYVRLLNNVVDGDFALSICVGGLNDTYSNKLIRGLGSFGSSIFVNIDGSISFHYSNKTTQSSGEVSSPPALDVFSRQIKIDVVCSSISGVLIYLNGELVKSEYIDGGVRDAGLRYIMYNTSTSSVEGKVNSFCKYNRALTPSEIQTNYLIDKQRFNLP